ncbi:MAG: PqqD family protein [Nitrososphaera sp.]
MIPIWIITSSVYQQYPDDDVMLLKRVGYSNDKMIFRRGEVSNDRDGTPLLINDRDEAYRVNDTAVSLWNMCNGINFDDLLHEVMRISSEEESEVRKSLEQMIRQFQEISVVEVKEIKSVSAVRRSGMQT